MDNLCGNKDMINKGYNFKCVSKCLNRKLKTYNNCTFKRNNI